MAGANLTAQRLRELVNYDATTGIFRWTKSRRGGINGGSIAGSSLGKSGYWRLGIDDRVYMAHRLAWLYVHGEWPTRMIDHIDGNPSNNAIANLRDVSSSVNNGNRHAAIGASGVVGAYSDRGRFRARIKKDGRTIYLGYFETGEDARAAYLTARAELNR